MSYTWNPEQQDRDLPPVGVVGWVRIAARGGVLLALLMIGVLATLLIRVVERPLCGIKRPVTPHITQLFCRAFFVVLGVVYETRGAPMRQAGAVVANHSSWLDIFALNARKRIYFVSKSEVAGWPGIGFLARMVGTVFITRARSRAGEHTRVFRERLGAGHKLLFFPEGTSTDGMRVLPFKPTLFQAFFDDALRADMHVQPVTVLYRAPAGQDPRFYGWWGDMAFAPHFLAVLAAGRHGRVMVVYHRPVRVAEFAGRKALAAACEVVVRSGMPQDRQGT